MSTLEIMQELNRRLLNGEISDEDYNHWIVVVYLWC